MTPAHDVFSMHRLCLISIPSSLLHPLLHNISFYQFSVILIVSMSRLQAISVYSCVLYSNHTSDMVDLFQQALSTSIQPLSAGLGLWLEIPLVVDPIARACAAHAYCQIWQCRRSLDACQPQPNSLVKVHGTRPVLSSRAAAAHLGRDVNVDVHVTFIDHSRRRPRQLAARRRLLLVHVELRHIAIHTAHSLARLNNTVVT